MAPRDVLLKLEVFVPVQLVALARRDPLVRFARELDHVRDEDAVVMPHRSPPQPTTPHP